ncbi:MAG: hypothetical protein AAB632_01290 [Patescibacteria group bacterium]
MYKKIVKKIDTTKLQKRARKVHEKSFLQEKPFKYILMGVGVLVVVNLAFVLTHLKTDQASVPLKYNYLFGIVRTGSWTGSFLIPSLLVIIIIANVVAAEYFYRKDRFLTYVFLGINLFLCVITFLEIIALNVRGS